MDLQPRQGPRPRTTPHAPHSQIDQLPPRDERIRLSERLIAELDSLSHVEKGWSMRAPRGTVGFFMEKNHCCNNERAFLIGTEFAHVHVEDDGSLHTILPEPLRSEAMEKGWAEPHPLAGQPTVSPDTVMLYTPRDEAEVLQIAALVKQSWANARRD